MISPGTLQLFCHSFVLATRPSASTESKGHVVDSPEEKMEFQMLSELPDSSFICSRDGEVWNLGSQDTHLWRRGRGREEHFHEDCVMKVMYHGPGFECDIVFPGFEGT